MTQSKSDGINREDASLLLGLSKASSKAPVTTAGRELDALVAERVMGFEWRDVLVQLTEETVRVLVCPGTRDINGLYNRLNLRQPRFPEYSSDIAAAWRVVEKLREDGWCIDIRIDEEPWCAPQVDSSDDGTGTYDVSLLGCNRGRVDARSVRAYADTMSLAICLAALKAVGG